MGVLLIELGISSTSFLYVDQDDIDDHGHDDHDDIDDFGHDDHGDIDDFDHDDHDDDSGRGLN